MNILNNILVFSVIWENLFENDINMKLCVNIFRTIQIVSKFDIDIIILLVHCNNIDSLNAAFCFNIFCVYFYDQFCS
jgi:hypothetical protein